MVDVTRMPDNAFGYVPTPALVAPIEFTLKLDDYAALGGHMDSVRPLTDVLRENEHQRQRVQMSQNPWPLRPGASDGTEK